MLLEWGIYIYIEQPHLARGEIIMVYLYNASVFYDGWLKFFYT